MKHLAFILFIYLVWDFYRTEKRWEETWRDSEEEK